MIPLAITQEFYHIGIAPNELRDPGAAFRLIVRNLGIPAAPLDREFRARKRWIYLHGPYNATQVQPLRSISGVHLEGAFQRFYPSRELARPIIGGLEADRAVGGAGLELALDSILTGTPGEAVLLKDRAGRRYDSPARLVRDPVPGNDVVLTIDAELQEIAERGLADALEEMEAEGGDVVFLDPKTGELLALASRQVRPGVVPRASTFTDPFEPGSTAKLFTAAALLQNRLVDSTDEVFGEGGEWHMPVTRSGRRTRTIKDVHVHKGNVTLAEAIGTSSNIAMAKFSLRLTPEQQYEMLRDFGFGTPTGAEFPSDSRGRLDRPERWEPMYTRASMAMGYELGVTPVQLAAAYGAIANDGVLMAPTLVREVRDPSGAVLFRREPEPVRRVDQRRDRRASASIPAGRGGRRRHRRRSPAGELHRAGEDGNSSEIRRRPLCRRQVYLDLRRDLPRGRPPARRDREDRQPEGELLRGTHGRTGHPDDAPAVARLATGRNRSRAPRPT